MVKVSTRQAQKLYAGCVSPWLAYCVVLILLTGCNVLGFPEPRERTNPYDAGIPYELSAEIQYSLFDDPRFIYPKKIAVSDDGSLIAVVSELKDYMAVYSLDGFVPLDIPDFDPFNVIDLEFGSGHTLYALSSYRLTVINCDEGTYETRYADSSYPRLISRYLSVDTSAGTDILYIYGNYDDWQNRNVYEYRSFSDYPQNFNRLLCGELFPNDGITNNIEFADFVATDDALYFIPSYGSSKYGIFEWDTVSDSFSRQVYYNKIQWLSSNSMSSVQDISFEPFSLDGRNGYLYCFANGPGSDAIFRWQLPGLTGSGGTAAPDVWTSGMAGEFEDVNYPAYTIAADPLNVDLVYVGEIIKWLDVNRITLRTMGTAAATEIIEGRDFGVSEMGRAADVAYLNGSLFFLDWFRGALMETDASGVWQANYGLGVLNPYEVESLSMVDGAAYIADHDYATDEEVVRRLALPAGTSETIVALPRSGGEILSVLAVSSGYILVWYPDFNTNTGTDEILVYDMDGTPDGSFFLTGSEARDVELAEDPFGNAYIAYTVSGRAANDYQESEHAVIDMIGPGMEDPVRIFSTMNPTLFSFQPDSWSVNWERFGVRDLAVTSGGFVWLALKYGVVLRLYPPGAYSDAYLHFQACLGVGIDGQYAYSEEQPLPYLNGLNGDGGVGNIVPLGETGLAVVDQNSGRVRFFNRGD